MELRSLVRAERIRTKKVEIAHIHARRITKVEKSFGTYELANGV